MSEEKEIGTSGVVREDWSEGDGSGSDRAGAGHEVQKAEFDERGRYSGSLAELETVEEQELEPANPQEVTQEERREIVEDIEDRAAPPAEYDDLSASTKALIDEAGYENIKHEQGGVREHLSHDEQDELNDAIDSLPSALNEKLIVALASGEFEDLQGLVEHLADGLTATQTQHLRRTIEELPARVRDQIDI